MYVSLNEIRHYLRLIYDTRTCYWKHVERVIENGSNEVYYFQIYLEEPAEHKRTVNKKYEAIETIYSVSVGMDINEKVLFLGVSMH